MPSFNNLYAQDVPAAVRDVAIEYIDRANPKRLYIPGVGKYDLAAAALRKTSLNRSAIHCSDMALFPTIIGFLCDPQRSLSDLDIGATGSVLPFYEDLGGKDDYLFAAATMIALRYQQITPATHYGTNIRRELIERRFTYRYKLADELRKLVTALEGIRYQIAELRSVVAAIEEDPETLVIINPPSLAPDAYSKILDNPEIRWAGRVTMDEPWDKQALEDLYLRLGDARCTALMFSTGSVEPPPSWTRLYVNRKKGERYDYLVTNRGALRVASAHQPIYSAPPMKFPIYDDHEITPDSVVRFVEIDKPTSMYYRDLFVHRLGSVQSEWYLAMLVDEQLVTVLALNRADFMRFKIQYIRETYGITISSRRYSRLGKMFMLMITTTEFYRWTRLHTRQSIRRAKGIQTTSLTKYPEGKTDRGVLKVVKREELKGGTWRLVYQADFRDETFSDALNLWLTKHGAKSRPLHAVSA